MLGARFAVAGLSLLSAPLVARALGPDGRGETAAVLTAMFLLPILLAMGMPYEVRRRMLTEGREPAVRTARLIALCTVVPALAIGLVLLPTLFGSLDRDASIAAICAFIAAPAMVSWMCDTGVLIAERRLGAVALMQCTQPAIFLAILTALWLSEHISVAGVIWASAAGSIATAVLGLALNRVSIRGARIPARDLLRGSRKFFGAHAIDAGYRRVDQLIMLPILGASQSGLYSVAVTVGTASVFLAQALASRVFADVTTATPEMAPRVAAEAVRSAFIAGVVCAIGLALLAPWLVRVVFGEAFEGAIVPAFVVIGASVLLVVNVSLTELISARDRGVQLTLALAGAACTVIVLVVLFGPSGGAVAAALAAAAGAVWATCSLVILSAIPLRELVPRPSDLPRTLHYVLP